jgi:hypothetical protein
VLLADPGRRLTADRRGIHPGLAAIGMKAVIWKCREDGVWRFAVRNSAGIVYWTGHRPTWEETLAHVLSELDPRWLRS